MSDASSAARGILALGEDDQEEVLTKVCVEIDRLEVENSALKILARELVDAIRYGQGHLQRINLINRADDMLEDV